jgi:hypothetical protein
MHVPRTFCALSLAALSGLAMAATASAPAASSAGAAPALSACKADAEKLCPGVQAGGGRIAACFKEHRSELSPECKKALAQQRRGKEGA